MFKFCHKLLPAVFDDYFISSCQVHSYNTAMTFQVSKLIMENLILDFLDWKCETQSLQNLNIFSVGLSNPD